MDKKEENLKKYKVIIKWTLNRNTEKLVPIIVRAKNPEEAQKKAIEKFNKQLAYTD